MTFPGGPGYPPNGVPVLDALSPLAYPPAANRGASATLDPPCEDAGCTEIAVVDLRTNRGCVNAYLLDVCLGIMIDPKCKAPPVLVDDAFLHVGVTALLEWGIGGGAVYKAECDWLLGTQLSIGAEYINVRARYTKTTLPWAPEAFDEAPSFRVSAGFALGNVGRNSNPARLTRIAMIQNPGETALVEIPAFALSIALQPVLGSPVLARKFGFGTGFGVDLSATGPLSNVGQYNVENAFPIVNGDRFLEVRNDGPGPAIAFVVFGLAL